MPIYPDDPNMSDTTILLTVEDLINRALGPPDANVVDFKIIQTILQILARQQRVLGQRVEINATELKVQSPGSRETSSESPKSRRRRLSGIKEEQDIQQRDKSEGRKRKNVENESKAKTSKSDKKEKVRADKDHISKEKLNEKEQEKANKKMEKEKEKLEREKERAEKERKRTEKELQKAERERPAANSRPRGSIEVVTQSQFALLEAAVKELTNIAAPKPLQLPDNEKLKSDLAKGTASLPEAMQTLQVDARVKATEAAIHRLIGLLTQLAAAGALPEDIAEKVEQVEEITQVESTETPKFVEKKKSKEAKSRPSIVPRKSVAIDPKVTQSQATHSDQQTSTAAPSSPVTPRPSTATTGRPSLVSKPSATSTVRPSSVSRYSTMSIPQGVTYEEMNAALKDLGDDISKNLNNMINRATTAAETALHTVRTVADRLDVALKLDSRISVLYSLVEDYAEQLNGFDSGLTTQMQSFQDQMTQIRTDLRSGLAQLENVNNNAETAAVMELTERYEELATELHSTLHAHKSLTALQTQLSGEMHSLVECVEMLREQKSDRDEVLDGLRDKADTSRLGGLLTEAEFAAARADFERRIDLCHDKFRRQDAVWMAAIRDLTCTTEKKAEIVELLSARDAAQRQLQDLHDKIKILAAVLGEPKAALLTRKLAVGATCGSCQAAALMEAVDAVTGAPPRLPALRPPPVGAPDEPCIADWVGTEPLENKHACRRWCGGSHTLLSEATKRERPPSPRLQTVPTKKFTDYGTDGRLYMFEEELQPCVECNALSEDLEPDLGAGDASPAPSPSLTCTCPLLK